MITRMPLCPKGLHLRTLKNNDMKALRAEGVTQKNSVFFRACP
jgi:hypothetical protein